MTGPAVHSRGHAHITRTCIFALLTKARCGDSTAIIKVRDDEHITSHVEFDFRARRK